MAKKENTYSIIQNSTSKMALIALLIVCNVSLYANSGQFFEKATYCFEGFGKKEVTGFQTFDSDNMVVDAIVQPRSVKKWSSIAEQTDGQNGYRLIQKGRDVVFEMLINGAIHNVTATDVFNKGESVYLSAYYKDGCAGVLVNGKKPVKTLFQIDGEKLIQLQKNGIRPRLIDQLSTLEDDAFYILSDFRKTLRKKIGRRAFKKYGDEIIQMAHIKKEQDNATCLIKEPISLADVPLSIGSDFSGTVEQVRIWQPRDVRSLVATVPEELGRTDLTVNAEYLTKLAKVSGMQKVILPLSNSLIGCYNYGDEKVAAVSKTIATPNVWAGKRIVNQQNCQAGINLESIDKVLKASSLLSSTCNLTAKWNPSVSIKDISDSEANSFAIPTFRCEQEMVDKDGDAPISMFAALKGFKPVVAAVKGRDFEGLNYDKYKRGVDKDICLGSNPTSHSSRVVLKREDNSKIDFCSIDKLASEKKNQLFEEDVCKKDDGLFVYISLSGVDDLQARSVSTEQSLKKCESRKLSSLVLDAKSERLSVIIEDYKKGHQSNKTTKAFEIFSSDAVSYVNNISMDFGLCFVTHEHELFGDKIWNVSDQSQNRKYQDLYTGSDLIKLEYSSLFCGNHNLVGYNGLFEKNRSSGLKLDSDKLEWNCISIELEKGVTSFCEQQKLNQRTKIYEPSIQLIKCCACTDLVSCCGDVFMDSGGGLLACVSKSEANISVELRSSGFRLSKCKNVVPAPTFEMTTCWAGHKLARSYLINSDSKFVGAIEPSPPPEWYRQKWCTRQVDENQDVGWEDWALNGYVKFNPPENRHAVFSVCDRLLVASDEVNQIVV